MKASFVFNLPAPALKASTVAEYLSGLQAWKDTIADIVKLYPGVMVETPQCAPVMPPASPALPSLAAEKGPWEREWLQKAAEIAISKGLTPKKSVRYTAGIQAAFPDGKESYCQALCEGRAGSVGDDSGEDDSGPPPALPSDAEIDGLH